jgi:hypothetical protein
VVEKVWTGWVAKGRGRWNCGIGTAERTCEQMCAESTLASSSTTYAGASGVGPYGGGIRMD